MSMSQLMVVQPLLDANKQASAVGKKSDHDAGAPFDSFLKDKMAARQPEKQKGAESKAAEKKATEPQKQTQGVTSEKPVEGKTEADAIAKAVSESAKDALVSEEDAAVIAQIMAAAVGAQVVPVEPVPVDDTAALAEDTAKTLVAATDEDMAIGKKSLTAEDTALLSKGEADAAEDDGAYSKAFAAVEKNMTEATEKQAVNVAAPKAAAQAPEAAAVKPLVEQAVAQQQSVQPQPVPVMAQQVQQTPQAPVVAQADPAASRVIQQMGTPEWNQAIGQRVLWMVGQEQQTASVTLNPPELGPVRIVVSVSNNHASANFFSAHPDVRDALEGSLPRLREMLEGAGIQLGQAQVGAEGSGNQQSGNASSGARVASLAGGEAGEAGDAGEPLASTEGRVIGRGLVDTFA